MIEHKALISGIGISDCGRRLGRDPWSLTAQAALAAIADAGLNPGEIDGVSTYPGALASTPGMSGAGADDMRSLLGLDLSWYNGASELPGQLGAIVTAMAAIGAGLANHVLCFRTVWESSAQTMIGSRSETMRSGVQRERSQWIDPIGGSHSTYGGLTMQRYMHDSGSTREQIGQIAVVSRANAALNPAAVYRDPMSLDDYMASRMISDPLCLYDCDVPMDGSVAFIVSRADSAAIDKKRAINVAAIGTAPGFNESAAMMWSRTDLKPADVDMAQLYDGFSVLALRWMEALGLCPPGEGGRFVEGGHRIALNGELPLNTNGGQLSGGRMHGFGALHEACLQMRGEAGDRQAARRPGVSGGQQRRRILYVMPVADGLKTMMIGRERR